MLRMIFPYLILVSGLLSTAGIPAQSRAGEEDLKTGLGLFKQEEYQKALASFRNIISDPDSSVYAPDAYFWSAKAYMALNQLEDADRNLEYFLSRYPDHPYSSEAQYQKGRLLYLEKDYENAIRACQEFIRYSPRSDFVPNALFWMGDSLYSLGKLEEAARIFNKVLQEHPQSFKVEAARNRLSLIDFKKRENELMRLLKWSHEEFLKAVEEFQRREKVYEQAIAAYQKTLGGTSREGDKSTADSAKLIEELRAENTALKAQLQTQQAQPSARLEELQAENAALKAQLQTQQTQPSARLEELDNVERALKIKAEALSLKESLLLRYEETEKKN